MAVTAVPKSITGLRPALSAILPETKRLTNAPTVNNATIHPMRCLAPISVKYAGSSGNNIPKLAMNSTVPVQSNQNVRVKRGGSKGAKVIRVSVATFPSWHGSIP